VAVALIVAAGSGERLGAERPKAFVVVGGRRMLDWSVDALRAVSAVERIAVALPSGEEAPEGTVGVPGGAARSDSVRAALGAVGDGDPVLVHDAARPLAGPDLFERALSGLQDAGCDGAVAAAPVSDTIKEVDADRSVVSTLDRSRLWAVQTPQVFRREALERALDVPASVLAAATDDAWLVERSGGSICVVEAPRENLKVTTPVDLRLAEALLAGRKDA
jgi:2-C-methyl-D-erythritol 4-phosphate cytidylyltransferase